MKKTTQAISSGLIKQLIREIILCEQYNTMANRWNNSWQWYSSGGKIPGYYDPEEDEIEEDEDPDIDLE